LGDSKTEAGIRPVDVLPRLVACRAERQLIATGHSLLELHGALAG
jgi:hypothetical protein